MFKKEAVFFFFKKFTLSTHLNVIRINKSIDQQIKKKKEDSSTVFLNLQLWYVTDDI